MGTGYAIEGGNRGGFPNQEADIVVEDVQPLTTSVSVNALEEEPTSANWQMIAIAICATAS